MKSGLLEFKKNKIGRMVPVAVPGLGVFDPYQGPWFRAESGHVFRPYNPPRKVLKNGDKVTDDIKTAIKRSGLESGMTVSFHHHLRDGDNVINPILEACEELGIRDLVLAPSSLTDVHDPVAGFARRGVVKQILTSGVRGELGRAISRGEFELPVVIRSHGGRARAVEEGSIRIDVAFLAASACDVRGNFTGCIGPSAFGSIGYAMHDALYAAHVIAVTDNLVPHPLTPVSVPQSLVDQVLAVKSLGDPEKISTGAARITRNPVDLAVARVASELISAAGFIKDGFSLQMGSGGASLAAAAYVREKMIEGNIKGGFGCGGMTGYMIQMLEENLFEAVYDVQSFDNVVTGSMANNPKHIEIDASCYANPFNRGCVAHGLDVVVLSALDVDVDYNVNVLTGHDGVLRGASGGHCDTAAGAKFSVVVIPSFRGGVCSIKESVLSAVTPGETVDAVVTERGVCINPARRDVLEAVKMTKTAKTVKNSGLNIMDIRELKENIERMTGVPDPVEVDRSQTVALVEYRDGTLLDTVYRVDC